MSKYKSTYSKGWAKFCRRMLKLMGWTAVGDSMPEPKAIVLGVPHTTVWDFVVSYFYYSGYGKVAHTMIKKEFFFWPLGPILRAAGCIPVDRTNASTMVKSMISIMNEEEVFHVAIAPEGTRKPVRRWKTGFHFLARATGAAVYMGYFDWGSKRISCGERFEITDDAKADLEKIQAHYESLGLKGKHNENYLTH